MTVDEMELVGRFGDVEPLPAEALDRAEQTLRAAMAVAERPRPSTPGRSRGPRRGRLPASAAAATVLITAAALVLTSTGHSAGPAHRDAVGGRPGRPPTSADIRAHVVDALAASANTVLLVQSATTTPGEATITSQAWYYPWDGQPGVVRDAGSSWIDGQPASKILWDQSFTIPAGDDSESSCQVTVTPLRSIPGRSDVKATTAKVPAVTAPAVTATGVTIDFSSETWQPTVTSCFPLAPGLDAPAGLPSPSGGGPVSDIRTMISDGLLRVVGHQTLNGQQTIEFQSTTGGILTLRLWVNASTYLPVRSVTTGPTGDPNPGRTWTETEQYAFLSPTQANLARLRVSVPPGFTEASSSPAQG
ncbi:hypothetical protein [Trebonia sp.]|uniref:hypothetical protein n=1 Tax=Trebonia sp. TaxID=2767075 RepID=UPI0026130CA3|nr:hypothetical protein [Trebonia sp.]